MFPPGRARLRTNPDPTASATLASTMGILRVACLAASAAGVPEATMRLRSDVSTRAREAPDKPGPHGVRDARQHDGNPARGMLGGLGRRRPRSDDEAHLQANQLTGNLGGTFVAALRPSPSDRDVLA